VELGDVLATMGETRAARAEYLTAVSIYEKLAAADPKNPSWPRTLAKVRAKL
jgi:hypothetical protein